MSGVLCVGAGSAANGPDQEKRCRRGKLAALEGMGIEEKALVYDEAGDKLSEQGHVRASLSWQFVPVTVRLTPLTPD
jgi:hypothetical protein